MKAIDGGMAMSCTIDQWKANATGVGSQRVGEGKASARKVDPLRLKPTNEGIIDDPDVAALRLIVEAPKDVEVEAEIHGDPAIKIRIDTAEGSKWADVSEVEAS